jgi:hypothetical protein
MHWCVELFYSFAFKICAGGCAAHDFIFCQKRATEIKKLVPKLARVQQAKFHSGDLPVLHVFYGFSDTF